MDRTKELKTIVKILKIRDTLTTLAVLKINAFNALMENHTVGFNKTPPLGAACCVSKLFALPYLFQYLHFYCTPQHILYNGEN